VLLHLRVGTGGQPHVVGVAGEAGEDLLAVDDVLVAVAHSPRLERGEVGARARLRVADAEVDLAPEDLRQEELLLLLGAEVHDRGTDGVDGEHRDGRAGAHRLVEEDELLDGRPPLPAVLLRPADAEPAVLAHPSHDAAHHLTDAVGVGQLLLDLGRQELGVVRAQLAAERLLLVGVADVHVEHVIVRLGSTATST
jgi:hypothetical protein